jgi:hypothetical protein
VSDTRTLPLGPTGSKGSGNAEAADLEAQMTRAAYAMSGLLADAVSTLTAAAIGALLPRRLLADGTVGPRHEGSLFPRNQSPGLIAKNEVGVERG